MLLIRDAQLGMVQAARVRELERRLLRTLELEYSDDFAAMGDQGVAKFAAETLRSAARRGVSTESAVLGLMRLYVQFGLDLQLAPYRKWANEMLDNPALPAAVKVNVVSQRLFEFTQGRRIVVHRDED